MISIPRFHDLLVGMAPVIQPPRAPEPVRCMGFEFHLYDDRDYWFRPTRLYWPDAAPCIEWLYSYRYVARNPILPRWRQFPDEDLALPHPVQHRPTAFNDAGPFTVPWEYLTSPIDLAEIFDTRYRRAMNDFIDYLATETWGPRVAVRDDDQSVVPADTVETLVDLARQDQRDDFMWLAGSAGVAPDKQEELWAGTRKRLGLP